METTQTSGEQALEWTKVEACTLPSGERPLRSAEFDELFAANLRWVERRSTTRGRLLLAGGTAVAERARGLADAESACCSFFTFGVSPLDDGLVALDVEVPPAYAAVLSALLDRAEVVRGEAS